MARIDVYASVTERLITMLDAGIADPGAWRKPWRAIAAGQRSAVGRGYRGVNTLILADAASRVGYEAPVWGTYKQWQGLDAQVRRGEKGTAVVLWKSYTRKDKETETQVSGLFATTFTVFNAGQVDNADAAPALRAFEESRKTRNVDGRDADADAWIASTGARIDYGGDRAYFTPSADRIALPRFEDFDNAETFYGTAAHELTHWSGHESRLDRNLRNRFGSAEYAAEELIAEIGAAFAMARLGLESEPRADHAHYLASWARLLREDNRAVFTAATKAQNACDYLFGEYADACEAKRGEE